MDVRMEGRSEPSAPADTTGLINAWQASLDAIAQVGSGLTPSQWHLPTPCPGWTVGDLVAHVVDIESRLAGLPTAAHEPDWAKLPHVTSDFSRLTEVGVDARRGLTPQEVLGELGNVTMLRAEQLHAGPQELDAQVTGFAGAPIPLGRLLRMRTFDVWVHEQDIRQAVGLTGGLDSPGAWVTASLLTDALPKIWGKDVRAPIGSVLEVDITGPGVRGTTQVAVGPDGRAGSVSGQRPDVLLRGTWPAILHRMTGRVSADDLAFVEGVEFAGDQALIGRLVPALNIAP